jgi:PhnB protein
MTSIAPWLTVHDGSRALDFYRDAFGAEVLERLDDDGGDVIVAQLSIDGADLWVQTEPEFQGQAPGGGAVRMIVTVADPDSVLKAALAAGATEIAGMHEEQGWRIARIADPDGHHWEIGRRLGD